ncbi:MAG: phage integrase Arm DNA-binding domain-containing protein [Nitrospinota bacterium]|nr:phage integrase Arm DNA-binding domain-containing protein [Nitrospinota bacterium]
MTKRRRINQGLPDNLYRKQRRGGWYYSYRDPLTNEWTHWGYAPEADAIAAALQLNLELLGRRDLVGMVLKKNKPNAQRPLAEFCDIFEQQILPEKRNRGKPLSKATMDGYRQRLVHIRAAWPKQTFADVTLDDVDALLDKYPARQSNVYRATLMLMWRYAISKGWIQDKHNLPADTIPRSEEVERQPLSLEGFNSIKEHADPWLQRCMDLALESLQGRGELARMKKSDRHLEPGVGKVLDVVRQKVEKWGVSARIRLVIWPELDAAIDACGDDQLASPYIVHRKPAKKKKRGDWAEGRDHITQVMPADISRAFFAAREASGFYAHLDKAERPTFHSIRALGGSMKVDAGWDSAVVSDMMAHADEETTNEHYLSKHHAGEWTLICPK